MLPRPSVVAGTTGADAVSYTHLRAHAIVLALNVLVWVFADDWAVSAMVLAVSLLALPVLHTVLFRR